MSSVWTLDLHRRQRDDILQESLLCMRRYLVKLVEVDEQHLRNLLEHLLLIVHLQIACITPTQFWRQKLFAKGSLVPSLRRDKQGYSLIAILGEICHLPLAHHPQKPGIEPILPIRILRGYRSCQFSDMVFPIPLVVLLPKIIANGIIGAYHV